MAEGLCTKCSATQYCADHKPKKRAKLIDALKAIVPFEQQDPDEQFYPAHCMDDKHWWDDSANCEGDTCNCGAWYRFADHIERTPV